MALLGSGMGNASSHSNKNLPYYWQGWFKHGNHMRFEPVTRLLLTYFSPCRLFGLDTDISTAQAVLDRLGNSMSIRSFILVVAVFWSGLATANAEGIPSVPVFIKRYCIDCHNADSEKGDRNFESLITSRTSKEHHETLKEVLDQLNLGKCRLVKTVLTSPQIMRVRSSLSLVVI